MGDPLDDMDLSDEVKGILRGIKAEVQEAHQGSILRLEKENDFLKKMLRDNSICPYGVLPPGEPMAKCPSGFPGCSCGDDEMLEGQPRHAWDETYRAVPCPRCGAGVGVPCILLNYGASVDHHRERIQAWTKREGPR